MAWQLVTLVINTVAVREAQRGVGHAWEPVKKTNVASLTDSMKIVAQWGAHKAFAAVMSSA